MIQTKKKKKKTLETQKQVHQKIQRLDKRGKLS